MKKKIFPLFVCLLCWLHGDIFAQHAYNLSEYQSKGWLIAENRTVSSLAEKHGVKVSSADGSGVVWLKGITFTNGTVEADLRGKDVKQGSFLGIAFHGVSRFDCEAVYFRPFNFVATDSLPRMHMVQYVQDTLYGWERLRDEHPGVYENIIAPAPNPNDWFHIKLEIKGEKIRVYVNHATQPSLVVTSLSKKKSGNLGLWVGNSSDGDFANLVVNQN